MGVVYTLYIFRVYYMYIRIINLFYFMSYSSHKGFTLIELLVVIAVIGILSSIVIASLNSARTKGATAAVKGGFSQIRAQAENYYDTNGTYGAGSGSVTNGGTYTSTATTMWTDAIIASALSTASKQGDTATAVTGQSTASNWAVTTKLKDGTFYCIDNTGNNASKGSAYTITTGVCV